MPQLALRPSKSRYWQVFLLCLAVSAALFAPHCLIDALSGDFFHYAGDFNDQQISFYSYANAFVKQGGTFSWATDLGSGFVNAYSFYLCGSPFFWLTLLLPDWLTPWFMVPMLCLKFAVAGGGAYLWMRRWVRDEEYSVIGACLYAFSGFTIYNIFFNHFLDVVALFPYLLASLDDAVLDGRHRMFPFWLGLNLLNNYFFFAGQAVFLIIYFVCLTAGGAYRLTRRLFGRLALETLLGCAMGCALLWPAALSLVQNPRTIDPFNGYGYLVYGSAQQYLAIFYSAFLMPDAPYLRDLFQEGILKHTSMTAYLPVVGIAGGLVFCRVRRRHPFSRILRVCVICAFVPVLNSMFYAFNSSYYARWYYMPVLILCAATVMALRSERLRRTEFRLALRVVALCTLSSIAFALVPVTENDTTTLGVVEEPLRYWGLLAATLLGIALFALLLHLRRPERFASLLLAAVLGFSFVYGQVHLSITKYGQWYHDAAYVDETWGQADEVNAALPDDAFYRIDAYECYNNMGLWLDKSCIQFFNSTVAPSILEFYPSVGVTRDVSSKPDVGLYALRGLLSVRYTLVPRDADADWKKEKAQGWKAAGEAGDYLLYENENWVPMGFTYDRYVTQETFDSVAEEKRGNLLMKALLLTDDQISRLGDLLTELPADEVGTLDFAGYADDCAARRADAVTGFTATRTGFTATADLDRENLVFFSVPYDDGFSATVNGQPAAIEKVDNGLMAVRAPAGRSEIVFTYHTAGLRASATVSGAACVVWLAGVCLPVLRRRRRADSAPAAPQDPRK